MKKMKLKNTGEIVEILTQEEAIEYVSSDEEKRDIKRYSDDEEIIGWMKEDDDPPFQVIQMYHWEVVEV